MMTRLSNRRRRDDGAILVEFAFLLPVLLLLLIGMLEAGRMYNARITLTHATREGARTLAVQQNAEEAIQATFDAAVSLDQDELSVSASSCDPGEPATVTSQYQFTYSIPFFSGNSLTMTSSSVMRCGG